MEITRRKLLVGALVGGGLAVAWTFRPREFAVPLTPGRNETAFDAWIKVSSAGVVTVAVPQLEMGQGITTVLPQVVAMELGADWRQVAVEPAPVSGAYPNAVLAARWVELWHPAVEALADEPGDWFARRFAEDERFTATADGTSLAAYEMPCRMAAASVRALLAMEAAARWDVDWEECEARDGFILHGDKRARFGELAAAAAGRTPPDPPPLRSLAPAEVPSEMGEEAPIFFPRLDLPSKVDGSYLFAGDVRLPGMVYAAIRHGPLPMAELSKFDAARGAQQAGIVGIVKGKRWLAALADNWWAAERALDRMVPHFRLQGPLDSALDAEALEQAIAKAPGIRIEERGAGDDEIGSDHYSARYDVAPALHATIETASVTARLQDGRLELWLASQAPEAARLAAARALGIGESNVVLYPMPAGGSFDRRLEHDHAIEAALIAREAGRPVQLVWSRWQEALAGRPRTPAAAFLRARTGDGGFINDWHIRIAAPPTAREFGRRLFDNNTGWAAIAKVEDEADALAVEGALPPYAIPNVAVDHVPATLRLSTGRLRGNAHGYTCFFTESFIDELAADAQREPLSYRIQMLGEDLRLATCLQRAARLAEWDGGVEQSGQGLACHRIGDGRIALIATASQGEGGVKVEKLSAAVDIGRIVNLDIARQQIEGGLVFGLGLALGASTDYVQGLPTNGRLAAMGLPKLADCPEIEIDFVASEEEPADPGELGVAVVAPAVANALHSASGLRLRRIPLLSGGL